MLNQFYKYLSSRLGKYFNNNIIKAGERFYFSMDEQHQVNEFVDCLKKNNDIEDFSYKCNKGEEYKTFVIKYENIDVVVASTTDVTDAYLVTIRNAFNLQLDNWKGKALLILCSDGKDSIIRGCASLANEGMPFNAQSISYGLSDDVDSSQLSRPEKEVVKFYIDKKKEDKFNSSIWDYQDVLSVINRGNIDNSDYEEFGLFKDKSLETYKGKGLKDRLKENHDLYNLVDSYSNYEDKKSKLEKHFGEKGAESLSKKDWASIDYNKVYDFYKKNKEKKALGYKENSIKQTKEGLVYWEKEQSDTTAGRRKRNIIVFNKNCTEINLNFSFDDRLSKEYIKAKSKNYLSVKGNTLLAKLPCDTEKSTSYKLIYEHNNQTKSKYEFNILIVNIEEELLENIKTKYSIKNGCLLIKSDIDSVIFGKGTRLIESYIDDKNNIVKIDSESRVKVCADLSNSDDEKIKFTLESPKGSILIEIVEEISKKTPIKSVNIIKQKVKLNSDFTYNNNTVKQETGENYIHENNRILLDIEKYMIENEVFYGKKHINNIDKQEVVYSKDLTDAYLNILSYYKEKDNVPSLVCIDDELERLYNEFLQIYNEEIESIEENEKVSNIEAKRNLHKLGVIEDIDSIYISPFSPLNIAYRLELKHQLYKEEITSQMIERLIPNDLLPYIYNDDKVLFSPVIQDSNLEWIKYEPKDKVSIGEVNAFVANVVEEKINQFIKNFKYLFIEGSKAPIIINVINIVNDKEVVKGVVKYLKYQIENKEEIATPIKVNIYNKENETTFRDLLNIDSVDRLESEYDINLKVNKKQLDKTDVMRLIIESIECNVYDSNDYEYCHISFYNPGYEDKEAEENTDKLESGISMGGLISTLTSNNDQDDYRIGFGSKNIIDKNTLIRTSLNMNEFILNCNSGLVNPYKKNISIVTRPLTIKKEIRDRLYDSSHWVTFIEPNFGLEYFKEDSNNNIIVIHYSDQYTTSKYDTITVTNKCNQYISVIKKFLSEKKIQLEEDRIKNVIKSFNSINGQWLLNLSSNNSQSDREKLSIISAIKYGLSVLDHKDIIWVPISLEEILRVSRAVKLHNSSEIFTINTLKKKGVHCDDLLFIGVNIKDIENIKLYYYPIEVKVGYNFASVVDKADQQIEKTSKLFKEELYKYDEDGKLLFKNKFFRNFFVKLLISNAEKLIINNLWPEKELQRINEIKKYLLNDKYEISYELEDLIGKGALVSFKKDNSHRSIIKENDKLFVELTEDDAYETIGKYIQEVCDEFDNSDGEIRQEDLLRNQDLNLLAKKECKTTTKVEIYSDEKGYSNQDNTFKETTTDIKEKVGNTEGIIDSSNKEIVNDGRILLGEAEGSTRKIYWEYKHKELDNRHMLITGKSGNGKTYFMQCALLESMKNNIPSVIIDYTDGFKMSQLEDTFKDVMGDRIKQYMVITEKFPLNPFKRGQKELDEGIYIDEDNVDIAQRFCSVIGAVYSDLGKQQINAIYEAVMNGLRKYDDKLNLQLFREELIELGTSYSQTAKSQLSILIDKNPFDEGGKFDWSELDKGANLFIVQLTGFSQDVKKIITEMILWDLWNYKAQFGNKNKPFNVILDEVQNLNFNDNSPCKKILLEGRKFGWSAWFATQFLDGQFDKSIINALQNCGEKIYFAQVESAANSVANIFCSNTDKKEWVKKFINLEKGSCISHGLTIDRNGNKMLSTPIKVKISSLEERIPKKLDSFAY